MYLWWAEWFDDFCWLLWSFQSCFQWLDLSISLTSLHTLYNKNNVIPITRAQLQRSTATLSSWRCVCMRFEKWMRIYWLQFASSFSKPGTGLTSQLGFIKLCRPTVLKTHNANYLWGLCTTVAVRVTWSSTMSSRCSNRYLDSLGELAVMMAWASTVSPSDLESSRAIRSFCSSTMFSWTYSMWADTESRSSSRLASSLASTAWIWVCECCWTDNSCNSWNCCQSAHWPLSSRQSSSASWCPPSS